ncbi:MAG TPA: metallopeptidase family protein [Candidatus Olsenella avicola]|uniref:metallopeptidase family protein n=1 Tax=Olsenella sp. An285 TaxID=1965621 RepID=UPI0019D15E66|nr:metallopeptidase family protein [Olsenella sp. An285]HIY51705.1 metallopeptidase family protein [Candidatus Olsenella avicola]
MTNDRFEAMVEDAIDSIPDRFFDELENVVFAVEDEPSEEQLAGADEDNSVREGDELLGLYDGTPMTERDSYYGTGELPDVITIFRGPHERCFGDGPDAEAAIAEEVRRTVIHEVGHYFGNDDETLEAMGY